ncbi:uncharacterized protein LOC132739178 [Ruditapes philippinarum]|uniref:uncharacterized protein LOC132739178 n=1 Tax=Ruditapes philippinarum TaxID=129788 RepID=UPI00295A570D|nr:uncharacterized protein LOC132739178 [Ruditapes philippinarum]
MDRLLLTLLAIMTFVAVAVSDNGCGPRKTCTSDSQCPSKWTCLGGYCYKCGCQNNATQCYLDGNSWACNCTGTGGYYGTDCKCPPESTEPCTDRYSMYSTCQEFSGSFTELPGRRLHIETGDGLPVVYDGYETSYDNCRNLCLQYDCHLHVYGADDCVIIDKDHSMPLDHIMFRFREAGDYSIYVRECNVC